MNNIIIVDLLKVNLVELSFVSFILLWFGAIFTYIVIRKPLLSMIIALVKTSLFFFYFAFYFDGTYTFLDDIAYIKKSYSYLYSNNNLNELVYAILIMNKEYLFKYFGSMHVLYYLQNIISFKIFGVSYYAPIIFNIMLSYFNALILISIGKKLDKKNINIIPVYVLYVLHWELLSWSSLINVKGLLVHFLLLILILGIVLILSSKKYFSGCIIAFIGAFLLQYLRYYVPLLIAICFIIINVLSLLLKLKIKLRIIVVALSIPFILLLSSKFLNNYMYEIEVLVDNFSFPLYGILRFILTPIPFNTGLSYSFLNLSSIIRWLFLPISFWGYLLYFFKNNKSHYFVLLTFSLFVVLYGSFTELQGPRHRFMLIPFEILFLFESLKNLKNTYNLVN